MKIYFAGSIRGGRDDKDLYNNMIEYLQTKGTVLTEHIGKKDLSAAGEKNLSDTEIHDRDMDWIIESDVIFAEVTTPSLGVGYEIGRAYEMKKDIICLYRVKDDDKRLSAMINGNQDLENKIYRNFEDFKQIADNFFDKYKSA